MSVRIRLARGGAKKRPFHQIVAADKRSPRDGRFIESIGFYNPLLPKDHPDALRINIELAKKWMANGAEVTERVQKLFATVGLCEKPAAKTNQTKKHLPKEKAQMRAQEEAERLKAAEEAKAAAEAEAKAAEEAAKAAAEQAAETPAEETAPAQEEQPAE